METIELEPLEKKDLLEILDYAKTQKRIKKLPRNSVTKWDDTKWWEMRIDQLKMVINGKKLKESEIKSSYETIDYVMSHEEKAKYRYRKKLESDILDIFNNKE